MIGLLTLLAVQVAPPPIVTVRTPPPPIVRVNPRIRRFDQWSVEDMGDYTIAYTGNGSGSAFGVLCGQSCVIFVNFQKDCEHGARYPAMINSKSGSFAVDLRCYRIEDRRLFSMAVNDTYIDMLEAGGNIGIALPLESGQFAVSRFSLTGALQAVGVAVEMATAKREGSQEDLRDFTI